MSGSGLAGDRQLTDSRLGRTRCRFLLEQGVALKACNLVIIEYRVHDLLQRPAMLDAIHEKARPLGGAATARMALEIILKH